MGDQLYLLFIKEQALVIDCMKIHPICTLLGGSGDGLDPVVHTIDEISIAMHRWLTEDSDCIARFLEEKEKKPSA